MICETHKPAYPDILNDKSMTSTENMEHKKGVSLLKCLKTSSVLESKHLFGYISVLSGKTVLESKHSFGYILVLLKQILKEIIQLCALLSS